MSTLLWLFITGCFLMAALADHRSMNREHIKLQEEIKRLKAKLKLED